MNGIIFQTFVTGIAWLCTSLFQFRGFDKQVFQAMQANMLVIVWLFIYCYYGQGVTSKFTQVADEAYESALYKYPRELQPYLILIIARAQEPFHFTGYKMVRCTLDTYKKVGDSVSVPKAENHNRLPFQVINTSVSITMVFRSIGSR